MGINGIGTAGYPVTGYGMKKAENNVPQGQFLDTVSEKVAQDKTDYDEKAFGYVAPNAPEEVKTAWMDASKEAGINGFGMLQNGMLGHISKMMVQQVVNTHNGKSNPQDILGSTVQSALSAAKKALYDLENPLEPVSRKRLEVQQQIMKEKEFYKAFISKLEKL